jgi:hypothetical protein
MGGRITVAPDDSSVAGSDRVAVIASDDTRCEDTNGLTFRPDKLGAMKAVEDAAQRAVATAKRGKNMVEIVKGIRTNLWLDWLSSFS